MGSTLATNLYSGADDGNRTRVIVKRRFWRLELLYIFLRGWQTRVAAAGPANLVDGLRLCRGLPSVAYGDSSPQRGELETVEITNG